MSLFTSPKTITISGAAGQLCYSLLFRLAAGDLFGPQQPVELRLLDLPQAQTALRGVVMEIEDCAFPLVQNIVMTDDPAVAFDDADVVFLVGSRPRSKGMERRDLMSANAEIFKIQGQALNEKAKRDCRVLVVGNPANTNASILIRNAPDFDPRQVSSMIRLDHNRALTQLSRKARCQVGEIDRLIVWGNHSPTMFADWSYSRLDGKALSDVILDKSWYCEVFIPEVARRGTAVIETRGASSAASAANAAIDQMRDWLNGTRGRWTSMAVASEGHYDVPEGLICGFPVICENGSFRIIEGLKLDDFQQVMLARTVAELVEERDAVR
ncbi:malate dehydrogenase [Rhizobium sp. BE258]|uniref:malate dehydrogenase n=1 Tax=Rhizobium sp. BE258 TaxID=2817722 RepID=UPI00285F2003|nr:malate dehydrogenase [Rhizobium sp. BE258]MDR7147791.1 malate dehydrogenase [Rhizobium sp. BE258]